ncbi:MAG TPA: rhomboid family intramembrane serine protease [Deferrisomatales bacterium]|nr:rhomboid family intramembrane serine protease [Deferrisomatales bacterium]
MLLPLPETSAPALPRPWATYALIALCVLVFIPVHFASKDNIRAGIRLLDQATAYYAEHPYLALDPRLDTILWSGAGAEVKKAAAEHKVPPRKGKSKSKGRGSDFVALEQAELDGLTRAGFDVLAGLPHWTLAVVPRELTKLSLVSHLFVHAAWLPLLGNLLFLFLAGTYLEARWRAPLLLGSFLLTGMFAAGVFIFKYPAFPVPLSGASGAVAGLVGAYAVVYGSDQVSFHYWAGPGRSGVATVPALLLLGLWGLREAFTLVTREALLPDTGAAAAVYWDHLAGFCGGLILGAVIRFGGLERRLGGAGEVAVKPPVDAGAQAVARAGAALREGRTGEAWQQLCGEVRRDPGNRGAVALLWDLATAEGRQAEAAPAMVRLVYHLSRSGCAEEGFGLWAVLRQQVPEVPVPATTEVRLGHALLGKGLGSEAQQVLATAASRVGPRELPMTLVTLAKALEGPEKSRIARMALDHPDLPPAERMALESLPLGSGPAAGRRAADAAVSDVPAPVAAKAPPAVAPLQVVHAVPVGIQKEQLGIELEEGGGRRVLPLRKIRGIAGAQVYDGGVEPEYLLDLVLEFPSSKTTPASVIRLHSGHFDPRRLVPTEAEVGDAMLSLAGQLLTGGGGMWLLGVQPTELRSYDSPADHRRELLAVLRLHVVSD